MVGEGAWSAGQRKRTLSDAGGRSSGRLARVQELSAAAQMNAPDPLYLERFAAAAGVGESALLSDRQREKVVKYINEVCREYRAHWRTSCASQSCTPSHAPPGKLLSDLFIALA